MDSGTDKRNSAVYNHQAYKSIDYSGFIERLFARTVDLIIASGFGYLIYRYFGLRVGCVSALVFDLIYRIIMTYFLGCTAGKFLFGVRVISRCSAKLSLLQVCVRETFRYISGIFLFIGFLSIPFNRRKKAWHDAAACTAVTSGGRDEAAYATGIYAENPERWNFKIWCPVEAAVIILILSSGYSYASYQLKNVGMIGFTRSIGSEIGEYQYKLADGGSGPAAARKDVFQIGDIDGDGGAEFFKEGLKDGKPAIENVRLSGSKPLAGNIRVTFEKPIIQYRLLDIDGDKKDELAVLTADKILNIYRLSSGKPEVFGTYGPVGYGEIDAVSKGKSASNAPYKLYILGDKNKLTIISAKDNRIQEQKFELTGGYNLTGIDMGVFGGKNYLIALTDTDKLVFFSYDGKAYRKSMEVSLPVSGEMHFNIRDINCDGGNDILISSPQNALRPYALLRAYDISGGGARLIWDGGRSYKYKGSELALTLDDGGDMNKDREFDAYMVSKSVSGQQGKYTLIAFEGNKYLLKVNDILRKVSLTK